MIEIWKDAFGYEDLFLVSDHGKVYSKRSNKILKPVLTKTGYYTIPTKIGGRKGKSVCLKIHRLVATTFLKLNDDLVNVCSTTKYGVVPVNHLNGNKLDNKVSNLEFCTYSQNSIHAVANKLMTGNIKYSMKETLIHLNNIRNQNISIREYCLKNKIERQTLRKAVSRYFKECGNDIKLTRCVIINILENNINCIEV